MMGDFWSVEQDEVLTLHWSTMRAVHLGQMLGKSKNAIIGRARRLNLPSKKGVVSQAVRIDGDKILRIPPRPRKVREPRPKVRLPAAAIPEIQVINNGEGIGIFDLKEHHCRAIIGRGVDGFARFCGMTKRHLHKDDRAAFCPGHCALYYEPNSSLS